jgi:competence ComEA-like helix-hairpin-helix protein
MRALFMLMAIVAMAIPAAAQQPAAATAEKPAAAKASRPTATAPAPVNLNTATQAQLEALPGIGPKAAELILDYRKKNGNFKKVEEILETARSCRYLLMILHVSAQRPVARNR